MTGFLASDERSYPVPLMAPMPATGATIALSANVASTAVEIDTTAGVASYIEIYCPEDTYIKFSATSGTAITTGNGGFDLFVPGGQQVDVPVSNDRPWMRLLSATSGSVIWYYIGAKVTW